MMTALEQALIDLESHRLTVALAPLRRPANPEGRRRVLIDQNPKWYRELCSRHAVYRGKRKQSTRVKRRDTLRVLGRLAEGRRTWSKYAPEILLLCYRHYDADPF